MMENNKFKYILEDKENYYYVNNIYEDKKYFPNTLNPFKIKKWKLFSIEKVYNIVCDIDGKGEPAYWLTFIDEKGKYFNGYIGEGRSIICSENDLINKFRIDVVAKGPRLVTKTVYDLIKSYHLKSDDGEYIVIKLE